VEGFHAHFKLDDRDAAAGAGVDDGSLLGREGDRLGQDEEVDGCLPEDGEGGGTSKADGNAVHSGSIQGWIGVQNHDWRRVQFFVPLKNEGLQLGLVDA
jgi:hypothetical protein